jgi:hypothetical protein
MSKGKKVDFLVKTLLDIQTNKVDPQTLLSYDYKISEPNKYQLCATFNADPELANPDVAYLDEFRYKKGYFCITLKINQYNAGYTTKVPQAQPTQY